MSCKRCHSLLVPSSSSSSSPSSSHILLSSFVSFAHKYIHVDLYALAVINGNLDLIYGSPMFLNHAIFRIKPEIGDLILFPSHLLHSVDTVTTDETRISLSFNVFFKGELGNEENLNLLNI
jgi:ectoine hydroxylase-related dioxygenase (phytanoyl-CoA dioxygenase family)